MRPPGCGTFPGRSPSIRPPAVWSTAAQASRIIANIAALLADQGLTAANVVKTTIFLTDIADFQAVNAVYAGFFAEALPARSCVAVSALPLGANVEIEVIAAE